MEGKTGNGCNPISGMRVSDLNDQFFEQVVRAFDVNAQMLDFKQRAFDNSTAILTNLEAENADEDKRILGLRAYTIHYKVKDMENTKNVVIKIKNSGFEIWQNMNSLAQQYGDPLASVYEKLYDYTEFCNAEKKDIACVTMDNPVIKALLPNVYHVVNQPNEQIWAYVMEDLRQDSFTHLDSVMDVSCWSERDIKDALDGIASFHALFYGRVENIPQELASVLDPPQNKEFHTFMADLWTCFTDRAHANFPNLIDGEAIAILRSAIKNVGTVADILDASPQTLIHNDCNVRNACLRKDVTDGKPRLCLYDWELVRYGVPQHDVAEFLMFVLPQSTDPSAWQPYIGHYRQAFEAELKKYDVSEAIMTSLERSRFQLVFDMSVAEVLWNRMGSYSFVHRFMYMPFLERVIPNGTRYLNSLKTKYSFLQD